MLPTYVALVPYDAHVPMDELLRVSAALQTQVVRDLSPLWGVSATVSPFHSLDDVPPGYATLAVARELPEDLHGFHLAEGGQPFALVQHGKAWSLRASHELLEMICDPSGSRSAPSRSLADEQRALTGRDGTDQGEVEYLVEVCDPCQRASYTIDGLEVSDFVTPQYYTALESGGARYSFSGRIKTPLALLAGGYITWRSWPDGTIWQAFAHESPERDRIDFPSQVPTEALEIVPLGEEAVFSRDWIDHNALPGRPGIPDELPVGAQQIADAALAASKGYGAALGGEIEGLVAAPAPKVDPVSVAELLRKLATDDAFRTLFEEGPATELSRLGLDTDTDLPDPLKLPSKDRYAGALSALTPDRFGPPTNVPGLSRFLATLGDG